MGHCWKCDLNQGMTLEILSWNGRYFSVITLTAVCRGTCASG
ncbi:hypothetical protein Pint_12148 [Pistacia integerrima]|uniref:Uncharacterized protein n=1 Tax=Pistacia integerrima TaxID=434235 RepID=A0ACC0XEQ4_9ROSI|nr:hypothetical protein Pint_12148 [Pistacia integerrima]